MNTYFVRFKVDGQLIQDIIKAYSPHEAIRIVAKYKEIPEEEIYIEAWRDLYGRLIRIED